MNDRLRVLVAGIGGASLGTEVVKSLHLAGRYTIFGCDVSPLAFGHYDSCLEKTFVVDRRRYVDSVLEVCRSERIDWIIPGGEEPLVLLGDEINLLESAGVRLAGNTPAIIGLFSDKLATFRKLSELGFSTPKTLEVETVDQLEDFPCPCVVKPAAGSGGSSFVFLAQDRDEAALYVCNLRNNGKRALVQEYVPEQEGEFTVGVLSLPGGRLVGSIAMRRLFHAKLSVLVNGKVGLISSGNSQGLIDDFPEVRATAERIARSVKSEGPLNIQGRLRGGEFLPFEINPRFSASTYLRAMAGFNEIDFYLRMIDEPSLVPGEFKPGYYLRSFTEVFVPRDRVVS